MQSNSEKAGKHSFDVLSSEYLLDAPILAVRRDTVAMPGGRQADREIVEHFGAVAIVALNEEGKIALVHQYRHAVSQRLWELPAGLLDIFEEAPVMCARRELLEEAGLGAQRWDLLIDLVTSPGFAEESVRIFLAQDLEAQTRPEATFEEADLVVEWVPLEQAYDMVFSGEIVNSIAVAGIMAAFGAIHLAKPLRAAESDFPLRPEHLAKRRRAAGVYPDMKQI